ncbi:MAG TPA: hypothetical protein VLK66_03110 [Longimicrobium sp.]|nr:hypothetical protein [Longimicrobium sp.]
MSSNPEDGVRWNPFRNLKLFPAAPADAGQAAPEPVAARSTVPADPALAMDSPRGDVSIPWQPPQLRLPSVPAALDGGVAPEMGDEEQGDEDASPLAHLAGPRAFLRVAWEALTEPGPPPDDDELDRDAADEYARRFAVARFARRVLEPDPHAWVEALVTYRERIRLPVAVPFRVAVEPDLQVRLALELPAPALVPPRPRETATQHRARYDELCCGIVLAFACDTFRLLPPAADQVYVTGCRVETNPATGHPHHAILLRLATDRASLDAIDLARASASAAFEHLGGAARRQRGELLPLAFEEDGERVI